MATVFAVPYVPFVMPTAPFFMRRPWLMVTQWLANRDRPRLERLRTISDPERFVWSVLPHAARTFGSCILLLPYNKALTAAIGYLYCRCLDTYEDLAPNPESALTEFAERFATDPPTAAAALTDAAIQDNRDQSHLLLVDCIDRIDAVYGRLEASHRKAIARCVREMSLGMVQHKCDHVEDLLAYCRAVIGCPVVFALELLLERTLDSDERETAMRVGEMVQLANISRDIEKDLSRGVVYDARLQQSPDGNTIRTVREDMMRLALARIPSYCQLMEMLETPRFQLARASALLMLLFTSRYYDECARRLGYEGWSAVHSTIELFARVFPAAFSHRYTMRVVRSVETALIRFCERAAPPPQQENTAQ